MEFISEIYSFESLKPQGSSIHFFFQLPYSKKEKKSFFMPHSDVLYYILSKLKKQTIIRLDSNGILQTFM